MKLNTRCQLISTIFVLGLAVGQVTIVVVVVASLTSHDDNNIIADEGHDTNSSASTLGGGCFRAAVYQHSRIEVGRHEGCQQSARLNLEAYERAARMASRNGAQIVVFPEDGLFIGSRSFILPCLAEIGDPDENRAAGTKTINPCLDPDDQGKAANWIMKRLSCMARANNIYVVANFGTRQELNGDEEGPTNKTTTNMGDSMNSRKSRQSYLMLNTNVVFDASGNFIKRYRKYNPYIEVFEKAPQLELAYFDTPHMGRLGLFTCFDIMFKRPALELVERHQVGSLLYPTWWFDKLPMHSAVQYQAAWTEAAGVNLLAANLLSPGRGSVGSGIYSPAAGSDWCYTGANELSAKLLVANVPIEPTNSKATCLQDITSLRLDIDVSAGAGAGAGAGQTTTRNTSARSSPANYRPHGHFVLDSRHDALARLDDSGRDQLTVCVGSFCCHLEYQTTGGEEANLDGLVLIAKDGFDAKFRWREQVCLLAQTTGSRTGEQVSFDQEARVAFSRLVISANFTTKYVLPMASQSVSKLISPKERHFHCMVQHGLSSSSDEFEIKSYCKHELSQPMKVNSFGFFARLFDEDNI